MSVISGDGKEVFAHQSILTACSPYFREALRDNIAEHPIVFLPSEVGGLELTALVQYMYTDQACVSQEKLQAFMHGARCLRIKGFEDMAESSAAEVLTAEVVSGDKGLQRVPGLAQSQSSWPPREESCCGDQLLARDFVSTYAVDYGKGPQHVSGDAVSASGVCPDEVDGGQQLSADHGEDQASQDLTQDLSQDSEHDTVVDSSSKEDDYIQKWSQDWMQVMAQDIVTEPVSWSDVDDAKVAWALRVPLGEDYGNDDLDCEGFY